MVRPPDVVADRFGRPGAQEDRTRVADGLGKSIGVGNAKLEMIGIDDLFDDDPLDPVC